MLRHERRLGLPLTRCRQGRVRVSAIPSGVLDPRRKRLVDKLELRAQAGEVLHRASLESSKPAARAPRRARTSTLRHDQTWQDTNRSSDSQGPAAVPWPGLMEVRFE